MKRHLADAEGAVIGAKNRLAHIMELTGEDIEDIFNEAVRAADTARARELLTMLPPDRECQVRWLVYPPVEDELTVMRGGKVVPATRDLLAELKASIERRTQLKHPDDADPTGVACPGCGCQVVYSGNYFCETVGTQDSCGWVLNVEDDNDEMYRRCYEGLNRMREKRAQG